jgi:hypothetical protein
MAACESPNSTAVLSLAVSAKAQSTDKLSLVLLPWHPLLYMGGLSDTRFV